MISAVVLAHNDDNSILKTLASLSWCDETIVIDDMSSDNTVSIVRKAGYTVFTHGLNGDFASQRNFGLSKAKGEWVLFVDSDEIVSNSLRREIIQAMAASDFHGLYIPRSDYLFGTRLRFGETAHVKLLRLAKKGTGSWIRPVHEVWDVQGKTGCLVHPLEHYPHPNVAQFLDSIHTYSSMNARYLFEKRITEPVWYIVAYPIAKFIRTYIMLQGFRDGTPGAILALMMSFHSFLTRAKLYVLWHEKRMTPTV